MNFRLCQLFFFLNLWIKLFLSLFLLLLSYLLSLSQKTLFSVFHWFSLRLLLYFLNDCWYMLNLFDLWLGLFYFLGVFYWELFLILKIFVQSTSEWRKIWQLSVFRCLRSRFQRLKFGSFFRNWNLNVLNFLFLNNRFIFLFFLLNSICDFFFKLPDCLTLFGWNLGHFNGPSEHLLFFFLNFSLPFLLKSLRLPQ